MKAMILAAGLGTRLRPLTDEIPKPMVPIVNKPVMEHIIELLSEYKIQEIVVNIHYCSEIIKDYFKDGSQWGVKISYSYEKELLGTAGGVKKVKGFFKNEDFLVISGDILTDLNVEELIKFHCQNEYLGTIVLKRVRNISRYGVALLNENDEILNFQEKPKPKEAVSKLANCGIYVFKPEIFNYIPDHLFFDFGKDVFPLLLRKKKRLAGFVLKKYWNDVGGVRAYQEGNFDALAGKVKVKIPGRKVKENIWIGEGTIIEKGVQLVGPICLGKNCIIGKNAKLFGPIVLGHGIVVNEGVLLHHAIQTSPLDLQKS